MRETSESHLADLKMTGETAKHNFVMLKQSLEDQFAAVKKGRKDAKSGKAKAEEAKAQAEL